MMNRMMLGPGWGSWDTMPDYMKQMMQSYWGGTRPFWAVSGVLDFVTSVLLIILLVAAIRWLWKRGS